MFPVNTAEAATLFLSEFGGGEDSCLCDVNIKTSTWVDGDGSMNFGPLTMSASITLQRQSQENSGAKILFERVKNFRINGLDPNGFDGIIQDLRLRLDASSTFFSAHDSSHKDAFEYFYVEAERMYWEITNEIG